MDPRCTLGPCRPIHMEAMTQEMTVNLDKAYLYQGNNYGRWITCRKCGLRVAYWPKAGYTGHSRRNTNHEVIMAALMKCQDQWEADWMNEKVIRDNIALEEAERRIAATAKSKAKAKSKSKGKGKGKTRGHTDDEQGYQPPPEPPQRPQAVPTPKPKALPRRSQSATPVRPTTVILPTIPERATSVPPHYQMDQGEPMEMWEHEVEDPWEELEEQQ
jgi:hypothetical protein